MSSFPFLSLTVVVFVLTGLSTGATVTATIDDTRGDSQTGAMPVYLPVGAFSSDTTDWEGPVDPDPTQAFDGTWQAVGPSASVTLSFTGTGIDVFCILANTLPTDLSFTLDGAPYYPSFSRTPDASAPDLMYGEQGRVLSIDGLDQVAHQLVIAPNPPAGSNDTLFLFDYARYRFDDEAAPSVGLTVIPPQISLTSASFSDATSTTAPSLTASSSSPSSRPSTSTSALGSTSPIAPSKHVKVLLATLIPAFLLLLASCAVIALLLLRRRPRRGSGSEQQGTVGMYEFDFHEDDDDDDERQSRWRLPGWASGRRKPVWCSRLSSITTGRGARERQSRWHNVDVSPYPMYPYQHKASGSPSTPPPLVWRSTILPGTRFSGSSGG